MALYAYLNEEGVLCITFSEEFIPEEFKGKVKIFENLNIGEEYKIGVKDNEIVLLDEKDIVEARKPELLQRLKERAQRVLSETDYIFIKALELKMSEEEIEKKYWNILRAREAIREKIQNIKDKIKKATTEEELREIENEINIFL